MIYLIDYQLFTLAHVKKMLLSILLKILLRKYIFFYRIYQNGILIRKTLNAPNTIPFIHSNIIKTSNYP